MPDTKSKVVEIDPFKKQKLIDLLCKAQSISTEAVCFEDATYAQQLEIEADFLISHGVTVQIKKRKAANRPFRQMWWLCVCGSCA